LISEPGGQITQGDYMQDKWFADNRDLVKWSVLFRLAEEYKCDTVLQIAYYRPNVFNNILIDGRQHDLPNEVTRYFRKIQNITRIKSPFKIIVFDNELTDDRVEYLNGAIDFLKRNQSKRRVVFLDPDTGLPPLGRTELKHALEQEVKCLYDAMNNNDVFVFYQHQTNRKGESWIPEKRAQLSKALGVEKHHVKLAQGDKIAHDVAFYYAVKA
jgi:hypothetical protein